MKLGDASSQKEHDRKVRERQHKTDKNRQYSANRKQLMKDKLAALKQNNRQEDMNKLYAKTFVNSINNVFQKDIYKSLFE